MAYWTRILKRLSQKTSSSTATTRYTTPPYPHLLDTITKSPALISRQFLKTATTLYAVSFNQIASYGTDLLAGFQTYSPPDENMKSRI